MSDVYITRNVKFIFNKANVLFTSIVVIEKLDDESKVIFRRVETSSKKLIQINGDLVYLKYMCSIFFLFKNR